MLAFDLQQSEFESDGSLQFFCKNLCLKRKKIKKDEAPFFKKSDLYQLSIVTLYNNLTSGQSYKHFTIVIYDPRDVIWSIFKSVTTLES